MRLPALLQRAHRRLRLDEERIRAFLAFVWRRFLDDRCLESAGALSYTTLFSLVPLLVAAFGALSAFAFFEGWLESITGWIFQNFVPSSGLVVQEYLIGFADNASKLTGIGVAGVLVSAVMMMWSVEDAYNRIWRVAKSRGGLSRFKSYWTTLTLGPLLAIGVAAASSYFWALPIVRNASSYGGLGSITLAVVPVIVLWGAISASYLLVPHAKVQMRHAMLGGVIATLLFVTAQHLFSAYLGRATTYQQIYGALAALPLFLLWIYLSWVIVLLGASLAASLSAWRFQPRALRVPRGLEFFAMLKSLREAIAADRRGAPLTRADLLDLQPGLTDKQLDHALRHLHAQRIVHVDERQHLVPLREPQDLMYLELFEGGRYAWPTGNDVARLSALAADGDEPLSDLVKALHNSLASTLRSPATRALEPAAPAAVGDETAPNPESADVETPPASVSAQAGPIDAAMPSDQEKTR